MPPAEPPALRPLHRFGHGRTFPSPLAEAIAEVMRRCFHIGPWARSPRPAPALRAAGASLPPGGLWPLGQGLKRSCYIVPTGPGKRVAFPVSGPSLAEAIAEVTRSRFRVWAGGPKANGQRPPCGRRALHTRRAGCWPLGQGLNGSCFPAPTGAAKRGAFRVPPRLAEAMAGVTRHRSHIGPPPPCCRHNCRATMAGITPDPIPHA